MFGYVIQCFNMQQVILHHAEGEMRLVVTVTLTQNALSTPLCQRDSHVRSAYPQ